MNSFHKRLFRTVFIDFDGLTLRVILAIASLGWFTALMINPDRFNREAFSIMSEVGGAEFWAVAFLAHFFLVCWRVTSKVSRPFYALMVNGYGFALWFFSTLSINVAVGYFSPTTVLAWVASFAAAWDVCRTGLRPERVAV